MAVGTEYGRVDDTGVGVEIGGGVGRGGIALCAICSDTEICTSWRSFSESLPVSTMSLRL